MSCMSLILRIVTRLRCVPTGSERKDLREKTVFQLALKRGARDLSPVAEGENFIRNKVLKCNRNEEESITLRWRKHLLAFAANAIRNGNLRY
jgi:hypothetical protein